MPTVTSAPGLFTSLNELEAPEGSLIKAENCVIRSQDVIEPRRGFALNSYDYGGTPGFGNQPQSSKQGFFYQDTLHVLYDQIAAPVTSKLAYDTGSAFTDYTGSYYGADESLMRMKTVAFRNNLYMTTTNGVYKISNVGNTPRVAGTPQAFSSAIRRSGNLGNSASNSSLVSRNSNVTTVVYESVAGTPVTNFVVNETVVRTSTDANFPSTTNLVINTDVVDPVFSNRRNFTHAEVAANVASIGAGLSVQYETQILLDASGFLADGNHCAYRFVIDLPDNNQQILLGPPGDKYEVDNSNGTTGWVTGQSKNVQLKIRLPDALPTNARLWVYRSEQVATGIPTSEVMYKAYEYAITSYDLATRTVIIKDITLDTYLVEPLYTSPTEETALSANYKPSFCLDTASWSNRLWFANTKTNYSKSFRIIGPLPNDCFIQITVNSTTEAIRGYTEVNYSGFVTTKRNVSDFIISTAGTVSQQLEKTARNIVECINNYSSLIRAFYEEDADTGLGFIRLESLNSTQFKIAFRGQGVSSADRTRIDPILPLTTATSSSLYTGITLTRASNVVTATFASNNVFLVGDIINISGAVNTSFNGTNFVVLTSTPTQITYAQTAANATTTGSIFFNGPFTEGTSKQETNVNRLYYSKLQQGEAVPLLNYLDVGTPGKAILRIIPLRERLYVFKEDGIFTIAGEFPFRVDLLDDTAKLLAADTCAVVGNQIFCLTTQGVVSVSESGVGIISRPWETDLFDLVQRSRNASQLAASWGAGYESDRTYMLEIGGTLSPYIYVYNYLNKVWTQWIRNQRWGAVHPATDKLYLGPQTTTIRSVHIERKTTYEYTFDYADDKITVNLVSAQSTTPGTMVVSGAVLPNVGDILYAGSSPEITYGEEIAVVIARNGFNITFEYLTLNNGFEAYVGSPIYAYRKYPVTLQWNALHAGAPAFVKQFDEWSPIFNVRTFRNATLTFQGDSLSVNNTTKTVAASPFFTDGRPLVPSDGLSMYRTNPISKRVAVPRDLQRCTNLTVSFAIDEAMAYWRLLGFNYEAESISPLANRKK